MMSFPEFMGGVAEILISFVTKGLCFHWFHGYSMGISLKTNMVMDKNHHSLIGAIHLLNCCFSIVMLVFRGYISTSYLYQLETLYKPMASTAKVDDSWPSKMPKANAEALGGKRQRQWMWLKQDGMDIWRLGYPLRKSLMIIFMIV